MVQISYLLRGLSITYETLQLPAEKSLQNIVKSWLYLPFYDWFGIKRKFQIYRKMADTIWFRFNISRLWRYFSESKICLTRCVCEKYSFPGCVLQLPKIHKAYLWCNFYFTKIFILCCMGHLKHKLPENSYIMLYGTLKYKPIQISLWNI